jgi:branched-chain amino acid transport system ATP-binding protein
LLELKDVTKIFNSVKVVDGFSSNIQNERVTGIIGPNGAGKTTLVNLISGMHSLDGGTIYLDGARIDRLKAFELARRGVGRTFQIPKPFGKMTVFENLSVPMVAVNGRIDEGVIQRTLELITLDRLRDLPAGKLSVGQQKLLEFGRVFAVNPKLILLDEPTAGVHPTLRRTIVELIEGLQDRITVVISHDISFIQKTCKSVIVMNAGKKLIEGGPEVLQDAVVVEAYMGKK